MLRLARAAEADSGNQSVFVLWLGAALYRHKQYDEAAGVLTDLAARLEQSADGSKRAELASALYFLAMVRHQLGHLFPARRILTDAVRITAEVSPDSRLLPSQRGWPTGVQLKVLGKEAKALILQSGVPASNTD